MTSITRTLVSVLTAIMPAGLLACSSAATARADSCTDLGSRELINMTIDVAESVGASNSVPAHCRVAGVIETEIKFELLLPEPDKWNGRFLMGGGGGFVGSVHARQGMPCKHPLLAKDI